MKRRSYPLAIAACLLALTVLIHDADARTLTFTAQRCGTATTDPTDLNDDPSITVHSFVETGTLSGSAPASPPAAITPPKPLPGKWEGIRYSCNGYVATISLMTGTYKFASGVCRFKDRDGNSIMANATSGGNKVEFQFKNGTGSWSGVTGTAKGSGSMPFTGTGQSCSILNFRLSTP